MIASSSPPVTGIRAVERLLARAPDARILVVGDFFLDEYRWLDPSLTEQSLETGLEAYQVVRIQRQPGAAGTVVGNLVALGATRIAALGFRGDDGEGTELERKLAAWGVDTRGLLISDELFTPTYCKLMMMQGEHGGRELNRFDTKNRRPAPAALQEELVNHLLSVISDFDAVIVADQVQEANCGAITDRVREALGTIGRDSEQTLILADSRVRVGRFQEVLLKPNEREIAALFDVDPPSSADPSVDEVLGELAAMGQELSRRSGRPVFVTCGPEGVLVCTVTEVIHAPGIPLEGPLDIVGAGDSATAGIVLGLLSGADLAEAAALGNLVASITVQKLGTTGTASPRELSDRARECPIALRQIQAAWRRRPRVGQKIEIVRRRPAGSIHSALFDFDGTLSLIRQGWQDVMIPFLVEQLLELQTAESEEQLRSLVREFVFRLTGKQTIYQMMQLAEEIRRRGGSPLEPLAYKQEYHRRLWEQIEHRVAGLRSGAIEPERLLVPGSLSLLERLRERGARLYLASGTDLEYVRSEVEALGLTGFFGDDVYAALPEYRQFSKKMVIDRIIQEHDLHGPDLVAFGDGYVEIENAKEAGGRTVGAATDEASPGQLDGWKRNRLIAAGADLIVADFSEAAVLIEYLTEKSARGS